MTLLATAATLTRSFGWSRRLADTWTGTVSLMVQRSSPWASGTMSSTSRSLPPQLNFPTTKELLRTLSQSGNHPQPIRSLRSSQSPKPTSLLPLRQTSRPSHSASASPTKTSFSPPTASPQPSSSAIPFPLSSLTPTSSSTASPRPASTWPSRPAASPPPSSSPAPRPS